MASSLAKNTDRQKSAMKIRNNYMAPDDEPSVGVKPYLAKEKRKSKHNFDASLESSMDMSRLSTTQNAI